MVVLAGAGPGDPGLVTLEAMDWLARADVVIYDRLVGREFLARGLGGRQQAIYVGKSRNNIALSKKPSIICSWIRPEAGKLVVRLKGGDPFIFGRGGEEAAAPEGGGNTLPRVPGITAASGAAAFCGLPLTDRHLAGNVAFVTAEEDPAHAPRGMNWKALAGIDTVVIYMGIKRLAEAAGISWRRAKIPDARGPHRTGDAGRPAHHNRDARHDSRGRRGGRTPAAIGCDCRPGGRAGRQLDWRGLLAPGRANLPDDPPRRAVSRVDR